MMNHSPHEPCTEKCISTRCNVSSHLMKGLPETVEGLSALKKLDFSRSLLGRNDIQPLVNAVLRHCSGLQVLNLSQNYLTDDSVVRICETLVEHSPLLVSLDLSNNPLSNKAGFYLLRFMDCMPALRSIGLQKTLMNDRMLRQLLNACAKLEPSISVRPPGGHAVTAHLAPLDGIHSKRGSQLSSSTAGSVVDGACAHHKERFPTLQKLWRVSAMAAPTDDEYASLATLISSARAVAGGVNLSLPPQ
ncbi:Leucine Rich repeat/Leucine Rich Repeat [Trypanosoma brucei equiperdum]|uniref:Leucine Rich repeat/Leucine Rich Repeat n=1 Tax=Trypanosoma brucei equiperdum TaxID=630700 RepID=A0A3L6L6K9_9TRYP|nr:Leucine Rich repeat/Leucine Rich Repeat [Trypanosoma brucei equiperdum]